MPVIAQTSIGDLTLLAAEPAPAAVARPPILFVPGLCASASTLRTFLEFFSARGHACWAVNLRGRGGSRPGTDVGRASLRDFVDDAAEAARWIAARHGTPVVVGHSLGGLVTQALAERGEAAAAALVAPAPPRGIPLVSLRLIRRTARYLPALLLARPIVPRFGDFRDLALNRIPPQRQREVFAELVPDSGLAGREILLGALPVDAARVRCPMIVVAAADDHFVPPGVVRRVARKYGVPLVVAEGHGHMLVLEPGWESIARTIAEWIDGVRR